MKKLFINTLISFSALILLSSGCSKEDVKPELKYKQLDSITHDNQLEYRFSYENGIISGFIYHSSQTWTAEYKNGKIYRYYDQDGEYFEFTYPEDGKARVHYGDDPTDVYEALELNADDRPIVAYVYMAEERLTYRYYYTNGNMTKMDIESDKKAKTTHYFEYDDKPNPWYELNVLDNFETFSRNNITDVNGYPYYSWTYDEDDHPKTMDSKIDGRRKYYYK